MSLEDYNAAMLPKLSGIWNLHNALLEGEIEVGFFITLSSLVDGPLIIFATTWHGSISGGISTSDGNHGSRSAGGTSVPTAKLVEHEQAASTAASPRVSGIASKKSGVIVKSWGTAVLRERGMAKKVKIADQDSLYREDEERPCQVTLLLTRYWGKTI